MTAEAGIPKVMQGDPPLTTSSSRRMGVESEIEGDILMSKKR